MTYSCLASIHALSGISVPGPNENTCVLRSLFPVSSRSQLSRWMERSLLTVFGLISFVMDAPPIPRHGTPSEPREPVRIDVFLIRARCAELCFLFNPDRRTVSGQGAGIYLEILGRVGLSPQRCCKYISAPVSFASVLIGPTIFGLF